MDNFPFRDGFRINGATKIGDSFRNLPSMRSQPLSLIDAEPPNEKILPMFNLARDQRAVNEPNGEITCCVSMALVHCMEAIDLKTLPGTVLSPLFHYYCLPKIGGLADIHDGILVCVNTGVCSLSHHNPPMSDQGAEQQPTASAIDNASKHRIESDTITYTAYSQISESNGKDWILCLASGCPLVIGLIMTAPYGRLFTEDIHASTIGQKRYGLHAVSCVGYSRSRQGFIIKDSRGENFGNKGMWLLPFQLLNEGFILQAWAIQRLAYN